MLLAGNGPREVTLESRAATICHFLQMVRDGKPMFQKIDDFEYIDQVVELAAFLDKYKCNAAMYMFFHFIETVEPVAPLLLFLVGVRLNRPGVCSQALDQDPRPWGYSKKYAEPSSFYQGKDYWKTPKFVQAHEPHTRTAGPQNPQNPGSVEVDMLLPQAMPCSLFLSFPPEHAWALTIGASMPKAKRSGSQCSGATFLELLKVAKEARVAGGELDPAT